MKNKRGTAEQVDWAMSLAIFLLFVVWFFLIIRPFTQQEENKDVIIQDIKEKFNLQTYHTIEKIPIFPVMSHHGLGVPVFVQKPLLKDIIVENGVDYADYEKNIVFLADTVSKQDVIFLKVSDKNYSDPKSGSFIREQNNRISIDSMNYSAYFSDFLLRTISFNNIVQIKNASYFLEGESFDVSDAQKEINPVYISYNFSNNVFYSEQVVFRDNSFVYGKIIPHKTITQDYLFEIDLDLDSTFINYDLGSGSSVLNGCVNLEGNRVEISNGTQSIGFSCTETMSYALCSYQSRVELSISAQLSKDSHIEYAISSYSGSEDLFQGECIWDNRTKIGLSKKEEGISLDKLFLLDDYDGVVLKRSLNISRDVDFGVEIYNMSRHKIFDIATADSGSRDVYALQYRDYLMDNYGTKTPVFVNVKTW
ncbi:MAG: hypothetical protein ACLFPQ_00505 [Candidatus Woesearchaeota archaeon]